MATIALALLIPPVLAVYAIVVLLVMDLDSAYTHYALIVPVAYILGSIPWGFMITRITQGMDLREYGSGKTGMTNVMRTAGPRLAALVLILDVSKGVLAVFLAKAIADAPTADVVAGLSALAGHNWSIFLGFKGGRGIATGLGGLLVMEPIAGALAVASFLPVAAISRYVSLGSITSLFGGFFTTLALVLLGHSTATYLLYPGIGGAVIIFQHRDNIHRILQGTERRLGQRVERTGEAEASTPG